MHPGTLVLIPDNAEFYRSWFAYNAQQRISQQAPRIVAAWAIWWRRGRRRIGNVQSETHIVKKIQHREGQRRQILAAGERLAIQAQIPRFNWTQPGGSARRTSSHSGF